MRRVLLEREERGDKTYCFRRRVKISAVWRRKVNTRAIIVIVLAKSTLVPSRQRK